MFSQAIISISLITLIRKKTIYDTVKRKHVIRWFMYDIGTLLLFKIKD